MYTQRVVLETNETGHFKNSPTFPPNSKVEVIVLILEKTASKKRKPAKEIAGKAINTADLLQSIIPEKNWQPLE